MKTFVRLYSNTQGEIKKFLTQFYFTTDDILNSVEDNTLALEIVFENPVEMADIVGTFIENKDDFQINLWLCIDEDVLINVTSNNVDEIIKYLYERFPY